MQRIAIVLACMTWAGSSQQAQSSTRQSQSTLCEAGQRPLKADRQSLTSESDSRVLAKVSSNPLKALKMLLFSWNPVTPFNLFLEPLCSRHQLLPSQTVKRCASQHVRMGQTEDRLSELGLTLPTMPAPLASYTPWVRTGNLIFISGHVPFKSDMKTLVTGKVGPKSTDFNSKDGALLARQVGLELISTLQSAVGVGNLDKVKRIVKLVGFVNCPDGFTEQPEVINGCSNLMVEVFGEVRGTHARSAVGTSSLPRDVPVEIEMIAEVTD